MNLDELERLLAEACLSTRPSPRFADNAVGRWAETTLRASPRLLALARAGERLASAIDGLMLQGDVFGSDKGGTYKYLAMLLHAQGDAALAAWREARDGD